MKSNEQQVMNIRVPKAFLEVMDKHIDSINEADVQLALHPKRATLCTLPWLSVYSMSTGDG